MTTQQKISRLNKLIAKQKEFNIKIEKQKAILIKSLLE